MAFKKTCKICKKIFSASHPATTYCTVECKAKGQGAYVISARAWRPSLTIRLTTNEAARMKQAAEKFNMKLVTWARDRLNRYAVSEVPDEPKQESRIIPGAVGDPEYPASSEPPGAKPRGVVGNGSEPDIL